MCVCVCLYVHLFSIVFLWEGLVNIHILRKRLSDLGFVIYLSLPLFLSNSLIFEKFSSGDPDTKDNSVGIQLLGIVLANNLPPFDLKCEIDRVR